MFDKKYKKAMKILDYEIQLEKEMHEYSCSRDYSNVENPMVRDELIAFNLEKITEHLTRWQVLEKLKQRLLEEIGE